jgi:hypothetical protein
MSETNDLEFLKEMKFRFKEGLENDDPTQIEFAQQMIDDWIDELEKEEKK